MDIIIVSHVLIWLSYSSWLSDVESSRALVWCSLAPVSIGVVRVSCGDVFSSGHSNQCAAAASKRPTTNGAYTQQQAPAAWSPRVSFVRHCNIFSSIIHTEHLFKMLSFLLCYWMHMDKSAAVGFISQLKKITVVQKNCMVLELQLFLTVWVESNKIKIAWWSPFIIESESVDIFLCTKHKLQSEFISN